jgi:hypothetical protein
MHNHEAIHQLHCLLGYRLPHRMYLLSCSRVSVRKLIYYPFWTIIVTKMTKTMTKFILCIRQCSTRPSPGPAVGGLLPLRKAGLHLPGVYQTSLVMAPWIGASAMRMVVWYTDRVKKGPHIGRGHLEGGGSLDGSRCRVHCFSHSLFCQLFTNCE